MDEKNTVKVSTTASGKELSISIRDTKTVVSATNNKAQYFAESAKKYRDEARNYRDEAKYFAEQNGDLTPEHLETLKAELELKIAAKQHQGNYALKEELPINVSELVNDVNYVTSQELLDAIPEDELPLQENCKGKFLKTDGENLSWESINSLNLFDTKITDCILEGDAALGWALQGTYVSKAVYPDFYAKCLEQKEAGLITEVTLGANVLTMYINSNGHQFYEISSKDIVDDFYNTYGIADFYGIDVENERVFLPRNNHFFQLTCEASKVNEFKEAGLPNIKGKTFTACHIYNEYASGAFVTNPTDSSASEGTASGSKDGAIEFNASLSNPIYGRSETVQPQSSLKLLYYCVGNVTVNENLIDIGQLTSDIQLKMETDLSNMSASQTSRNEIISWLLPDYTAGITGAVTANTVKSYTAPANGWIVFNLTAHGNGTCYIKVNGVNIMNNKAFTNPDFNPANGMLPVSKGDEITYFSSYNGTSYNNQTVTFYPMKGG